MADFTQIIQEINADINTNGSRTITGDKLNTVLRDMIAAVNAAKEDSLQYYSEDEDNERVDIGGTSLLRANALENIVLSIGVWTVRLDSSDDIIVLGNTNNNTKIEIRSDEINLSVDYGDGDVETLLISNHKIRWNDEPIPTTPDFARVAFSGSYADLNNKPDLSTKADKVSSATNGHFAGLDSNGNLNDSGIAASDVATTSDLAGKQDIITDLATIRSGAAAGATAYQKPSGGIPKTDLASGVQTSLGKADTAVQQVTVGTTTTGNAGTNASVTNSGTSTAPVLDFTIPRGADGADGQDGADAVNPFKGWWPDLAALKAAHTATAGDSAYVKDASPATTWSIYVYDSTASSDNYWADSGTDADTSNVQTFASGEEVNEVHIVNDLTTGGIDDVLSAEQGKILENRKINNQDENIVITYTELTNENGYPKNCYINALGGETASNDFKVNKYAVTPGQKYYITGSTGTGAGSALAAFYDDNNNLIDSVIKLGAYVREQRYEVLAPQNAAYIKVQQYNSAGSSYYANCEYKTETTEILQDNKAIIDSVGDVTELETFQKEIVVKAINEVYSNVKDIADINVSPNLFDKTKLIDKIVHQTGVLTTIPSWTYNKCTGLIPVQPNKVYCISGDDIVSGLNIRALASDGETYYKVLAASAGTNSLSNYNMPNVNDTGTSSSMNIQFKTPSNAAFVQFNISTENKDSSGTTMLELVGDTYNDNFTPSTYIQYGKVTAKIKDSKPIKILLVGSSHGLNTITQVPWIAYKSGVSIEVGNVYIGSLSLQRVVGMIKRDETCTMKYFKDGSWQTIQNLKFKQVFKYTDWDIISLQRSADDDELWYTTQKQADDNHLSITNINYGTELDPVYMSHNDALQFILEHIKNNSIGNSEIVFNTGFADAWLEYPYDEPPTQTTKIIDSAKQMKQNFGIDYIPTAIALRNARKTYLKNFGKYNDASASRDGLLSIDGQHLDYGIGCYVVGVCFLEYVCRKYNLGINNMNSFGTKTEVQQNALTQTISNDSYTELTDDMMAAAKACAMCAIDTPESISEIVANRFKYQVQLSLGSGITSSNTREYCANEDVYKTTLNGATSVSIVSQPFDRTQSSVILTQGIDYTFINGDLTINSVQGDITITANR